MELESHRRGEKKSVRLAQLKTTDDERIQKLEEQIRGLQANRERETRFRKEERNTRQFRGRPWTRARGRGRGIQRRNLCYFCEAEGHFMRDCPMKKMWIQSNRFPPSQGQNYNPPFQSYNQNYNSCGPLN